MHSMSCYHSSDSNSSNTNTKVVTLAKDEEWCRIKAVFFTSWTCCFTMESVLHMTGHRKMDLLLCSRNKPKIIVFMLNSTYLLHACVFIFIAVKHKLIATN